LSSNPEVPAVQELGKIISKIFVLFIFSLAAPFCFFFLSPLTPRSFKSSLFSGLPSSLSSSISTFQSGAKNIKLIFKIFKNLIITRERCRPRRFRASLGKCRELREPARQTELFRHREYRRLRTPHYSTNAKVGVSKNLFNLKIYFFKNYQQ
jgi:hypothetical protein